MHVAQLYVKVGNFFRSRLPEFSSARASHPVLLPELTPQLFPNPASPMFLTVTKSRVSFLFCLCLCYRNNELTTVDSAQCQSL